MNRREQLHRLVRDLKSLAEWQTSGLSAPALPIASEEERQALELRKRAMRGLQVSALQKKTSAPPAASSRTANAQTDAQPWKQPKPAAPASPAPTPKPSAVAAPEPPPVAQPKTSSEAPKMPTDILKKAPQRRPAPVMGGDAPWKVAGARPKPTYRTGAANPTTERAWSDESLPNIKKLEMLQEFIGNCQRCGLCASRTEVVFGEGNAEARLMFIGGPPSHIEDRQSRPFLGKSGQLLDKMIEAMGFQRADVYLSTVTKCRTPEDQAPSREELLTCAPFLRQQIEAVQPEVIVTLGRYPTSVLLDMERPPISVLGSWHDYEGIAVMPTFHPGHLLESGSDKRQAWNHLQMVMKRFQEG